MAPTLADYLHGLRRLWWVPLIPALVGIGLGLLAGSTVRPNTQTYANAMFIFQNEDPRTPTSGVASGAEPGVGASRLASYVQLASSSPQIRKILETANVSVSDLNDPDSRVFIDGSGDGMVEVRVTNGDLSQSDADQLVQDLTREVVRQALAIDAQQATPSLRPKPLTTQPQPVEMAASRLMRSALPVLLLTSIGMGLVYVIVWRQGRIRDRRSIEERLGARVLGDIAGRPADGAAIALALTRGRVGGTRALLVPLSLASKHSSAVGIGETVAAARRELGLAVNLVTTDQVIRQPARALGGLEVGDPGQVPTDSLILIEAPRGLDARAVLIAATADMVALVVDYDATTFEELTQAGHTLAEVTDADIAVIGVHGGPGSRIARGAG